MTRALARDLGEANIRVNCVVPGAIRTPRQMKLWHTPEEEAKILAQQCLKARVDPRARHRHGAVPGLRRRRACALRTTTGWTRATAERACPTVECVWPVGAMLGEGPVWSAAEQAVVVRRHQGARHPSLSSGERRAARPGPRRRASASSCRHATAG